MGIIFACAEMSVQDAARLADAIEQVLQKDLDAAAPGRTQGAVEDVACMPVGMLLPKRMRVDSRKVDTEVIAK